MAAIFRIQAGWGEFGRWGWGWWQWCWRSQFPWIPVSSIPGVYILRRSDMWSNKSCHFDPNQRCVACDCIPNWCNMWKPPTYWCPFGFPLIGSFKNILNPRETRNFHRDHSDALRGVYFRFDQDYICWQISHLKRCLYWLLYKCNVFSINVAYTVFPGCMYWYVLYNILAVSLHATMTSHGLERGSSW